MTNEEGGTRMTWHEWLIVVGLTALACAVICYFKGHRKGYELAQRLAPDTSLPAYSHDLHAGVRGAAGSLS